MGIDFNELARKGIPDKQAYEPGKSVGEVKKELGLLNVIKMASNENPLGPSPRAVKALEQAISTIHSYPNGKCTELREKLSGKLGVDHGMLHFGSGADEVIASIFNAFFNPGDTAVMGKPTFSSYELSCATAGGIAIGVPLREYRNDIEAMIEAIDVNTKAMFIASPHNPTGTIVTKDELEFLLEKLPLQVLIVLDEAYCEFAEDSQYPDSLSYIDQHPNLIVVRTFSKVYGLAGLRVGYAVASPEVVSILDKVKLAFNVTILSQIAAEAALDDEDSVEKYRRMNSEGRKYLTEELTGLGFEVVPSQANFIWFGYGGLVDDLPQKLLERGIIVRDGNPFGAPDHVRVTVGTPEQNREFMSVIKQLL